MFADIYFRCLAMRIHILIDNKRHSITLYVSGDRNDLRMIALPTGSNYSNVAGTIINHVRDTATYTAM